jgi:hypothetical protein
MNENNPTLKEIVRKLMAVRATGEEHARAVEEFRNMTTPKPPRIDVDRRV